VRERCGVLGAGRLGGRGYLRAERVGGVLRKDRSIPWRCNLAASALKRATCRCTISRGPGLARPTRIPRFCAGRSSSRSQRKRRIARASRIRSLPRTFWKKFRGRLGEFMLAPHIFKWENRTARRAARGGPAARAGQRFTPRRLSAAACACGPQAAQELTRRAAANSVMLPTSSAERACSPPRHVHAAWPAWFAVGIIERHGRGGSGARCVREASGSPRCTQLT